MGTRRTNATFEWPGTETLVYEFSHNALGTTGGNRFNEEIDGTGALETMLSSANSSGTSSTRNRQLIEGRYRGLIWYWKAWTVLRIPVQI
ncbi:hypothetical protein SUGI_1028450 [Cryptomeria japonica]|nr:hypothetical protein SUGI_1028450 [Cryptomeria japonica]